jgi:exosortase family protein XrtM
MSRQPSRRSGIVFVGTLIGTFTLLQVGYLALDEAFTRAWVVDFGTVRPAVAFMGWLDPSADVIAQGHRMVGPTARLNVLRGCEGTELYFLWIAAVLALPATWTWRVAGMAGGVFLAFVLNQARVIGLFYVVRDQPGFFPLAHGYLAPGLLVVLLGLAYWQWSARAT